MAIPTIDLSPFFTTNNGDCGDDEHTKSQIQETIVKACSEYGFFQIVNHGVPLDLMSRAVELSRSFFELPMEEKLKLSPRSGSPLPAGYNKRPDHSIDKNEYFMMFPPRSNFNVYPTNPSEFREVVEAMFLHLTKTGQIVEGILNDCLGLPPNFLQQYNNDRSRDLMVALRYFPGTEAGGNGVSKHEDPNCVTFVVQDDIGGLEVRKDGEWIPVVPVAGTLVVNVCDVIRVLSNNKFKSATHRVVRPVGKSRYAFAFFYNLEGEKWVEPLPQFTTEIGEKPKYRGFVYKEYQGLRMRNKTHPPSRPEDMIDIGHYAIP